MLYYLRQEVIGDQAERILEEADSRFVNFFCGFVFLVSCHFIWHKFVAHELDLSDLKYACMEIVHSYSFEYDMISE